MLGSKFTEMIVEIRGDEIFVVLAIPSRSGSGGSEIRFVGGLFDIFVDEERSILDLVSCVLGFFFMSYSFGCWKRTQGWYGKGTVRIGYHSRREALKVVSQ